VPPTADDVGTPPPGCGPVAKDRDGFFQRDTAAVSYVGYVPKSYSGAPTTLVIGLHGCRDEAKNFAAWAVNPYETRDAQSYIGISLGGRDGACWSTPSDAKLVFAALEDVSKCFYVNKRKVVLAGYSSGGILAYNVAFGQAKTFAGLLIENSGLAGANPASAAWKMPVAHIAHRDDGDFPLSAVHADWAKLEAAGIPVIKREVKGTHDGDSGDWSGFLLPQLASWRSP
jgi:poly(3-hydroxybutyrate) depolymerase